VLNQGDGQMRAQVSSTIRCCN